MTNSGESLFEHIRIIPDPGSQNKKHRLESIMFIAICPLAP